MIDSKDGITVTKLDAAKRQLTTALHLWFNDGDPVSIHALLAAAHEIIHRLYRNKGLRNLMFDNELINDEYRGEFAKTMKKAPSFFKHAAQDGRDAAISITFYPEVNDVLPLFLIQGLRDMGETLGLEEASYIHWMIIHEPNLFQSKGNFLPVDLAEQMIGINKAEFFKACEVLWRQGKLRDFIQARSSS